MEPLTLFMLWAVAFATAVLSGIVGMAGGITLLAVMLLFLPPMEAIPIHGIIQLASNSSRSWIQRKHVDRSILLFYALPLLPAGALMLPFVTDLPEKGLKAAIGVFVLVATWAPHWLLLGARPDQIAKRPRFLGLGVLAGAMNVTIGAVGPMIAPFFLGIGMERQALVGTKAACQALGHLAKVILFGVAGFAFADHLFLMAGAIVAVIAGTWVGSQILDRVSENAFTWIYRSVLTLIALRLALGGFLGVS